MNKTDNGKKFVYCGSSDWSAAILASLIEAGHSPSAVITKIDKPSGRGLKEKPAPLKLFAQKNNLINYEVKNKLEFEELINKLQPDFGVVVDFGIIITKSALSVPQFGFINVHPSLLPKYRGTSPIQSAILNGDQQTGVSIMLLDEEVDHGPIFSQKSVTIENTDTYGSLLEKLAPIASQELINAINNLETAHTTPQNHDLAVFTKKINVAECEINLNTHAENCARLIRAVNPKPGAWLNYKDKRLKIFSATVSDAELPKNLCLKCADGKYLVIDKLQPEGKKEMSGRDFWNGMK